MKKFIFALGLMSVILALTSCQKDFDGDVADAKTAKITQTITLGEQTRTSYKDGVGVTMDGNEKMTVYYMATDDEDLSTYTFANDPKVRIVATNDGNNNFTFEHTAIADATSYDYYFMMPDNSTNKMNSQKSASNHRLGPVQRPSAASFDPAFDYIAGKPVTIAAENINEATVVDYKRLFSVLKVKFVDSEGLLDGQKIQSVNIKLSEAATQNVSLQGLFYMKYSDVFENTKINSWEKSSVSNGMTVSYDEGIEQNGSWESWFVIRETTIPACDMTVTVVADNKTLSRTFAFNETALAMDKINTLTIGLSEAKCTVANSFTVDFSARTSVPASIIASDGQTIELSSTNCLIGVDAEMGNALQVKSAGEFTLPALADGLKYKAIYLTENVMNNSKDFVLTVKAGETEIGTCNFNYYGETMRANGGVVKVEIPAEYATQAIKFVRSDAITSDNNCRILRITAEYEGNLPEPEPVSTNYYTDWDEGRDIVIGTEAGDEIVVNKTNYPTAAQITADMTGLDIHKILTAGGLIFVDSDVDYYTSSADANADHTEKHVKFHKTNPTIIIGCDPTTQPKIKCEGQYYANGPLLVIKNIEISQLGDYGIISSKEGGDSNCKLYMEDCTYYHAKHAIAERDFAKRCFSHVYVLNSILHQTNLGSSSRAIFNISFNISTTADYSATVAQGMQAIKLVNSVFYADSDWQQYLIDAGNNSTNNGANYQYDTQNLEMVIKNCSTYGLWQSNIFARAYKLKSCYFGYNVGWYDNTANKNTYLMGDYAKLSTTAVSEYNFLVTRADVGSNGWKKGSHGNVCTYTDTTSTIIAKDTEDANFPFASSMDIASGYFPINYSVVPSGCGASYETKLWINK